MNKILQVIAEAHSFGNIIYHNQRETPKDITRDAAYYQNRTRYVHKLGETQEILSRIKGYQHFHELQKAVTEDEPMEINGDLKQNLLISQKPIKTINFIQYNFNPLLENKTNKTVYKIEKTIPISFLEKKKIINKTSKKDLIIGDLGNALEYFILEQTSIDIENNEPVILISGSGNHYQTLKLFNTLKKENWNNLYVLNFIYDKNTATPQTHSINPMDMWLLSKFTFDKTFPESISAWLYPYLMHLKQHGKQVSLESLFDILSLSTVILMAKSNNYNNQAEAIKYLESVDFNFENPTDKEISATLNKHIKNLGKLIDVISYIQNFMSTGHFSDEPTINLMHIFARKKYLSITFPSLRNSAKKHQILATLINSLVLGAESLNNKEYCQNIYCIDTPMNLSEGQNQKNSANSFVIAHHTPYDFKSEDLNLYERIIFRKVFKIPEEIEKIIFNHYFSSKHVKSLDFISSSGKINVFDSNKNRVENKYNTEFLRGLISFSLKEDIPAYYYETTTSAAIQYSKVQKYFNIPNHVGGKYE